MISILVIITYTFCLLCLLILGFGQFYLALKYKNAKYSVKERTPPAEWPIVTIQLPIYNELYVAERLLASVASLDYPKEKLEIQVLDDSDDETVSIVANKVSELERLGFIISHIKRENRIGFKAGALQYGLNICAGEYIAIFDADFMPKLDFLKQTIPILLQDGIGMVQTRWGHINKNYSWLTRAQAFGLDGHFTVEQAGRAGIGSFINFNGTAGVWRKECINSAGGWSADTLTEDFDLSFRAQLKGWKFMYLEDAVTAAELPVLMTSVKSQQYRWNKGAAETTKKNIRSVINANIPWSKKVVTMHHLLSNTAFIFVFIAAIFSVPMVFVKTQHPSLEWYFHLLSIFILGFIFIAYFYWISSRKIEPQITMNYWAANFPKFMVFSLGLSFHNAVAVASGYLGIKSPFVRTPKFAVDEMDKITRTNKTKYLKSTFKMSDLIELFLFFYFFYGMFLGWNLGDYGLIPFHFMLAAGFLVVFYHSLLHQLYYGTKS
jgi:cellulose synthase/poly-beta-1,6-N-acetylglucosamine synthase-like glycosyltransferase